MNCPPMMPSGRPRQFPSTRWSLIVRLKSPNDGEARQALEEVFTSYRYPLYGYLRSTRLNHDDAEDVLQSFFEKMLRNDGLSRVDRERGKLRTFLLVSLSRFRINWKQSEQRRHERVKAEADFADADAARYQLEQHSTLETPEHFYDRHWAMELIERARRSLQEQYEKRGKQPLHAALAPLLSSALPETESFSGIATRLGVTENALRVSLHRLRGDFRDLLLLEVQSTLDEGEDAREEIRHLLALFE